MSQMGQTRRSGGVLVTSGLPSASDISLLRTKRRDVPEAVFKPVESELACLALSPFALSGKEADA